MSPHAKGLLLSFIGVLILSPDTLLVRLLDMDQWSMQFARGLGVGLCLLAGTAVVYRRKTIGVLTGVGPWGVATGACHAASSILFITAVYLTGIAETLVIISTAPLFGAVLSRAIIGERIAGRTIAAALMALCAVGVIVGADFGGGGSRLLGDLAALGQALLMATTFVLVRKRSEVNMLPCMIISGFIMAAVSLPFMSASSLRLADPLLLAILTLFVLPASFACLFVAPRYIPAPEVNLTMLLEMIIAPLLVWWVVGEAVRPQAWAGGALLLTALTMHWSLSLRSLRR